MGYLIDLDGKITPLLTGVQSKLQNSTKTRLDDINDDSIKIATGIDFTHPYIKIILGQVQDANMPEATVVVRLSRKGIGGTETYAQEFYETMEDILSEIIGSETGKKIGDWKILKYFDARPIVDRRDPDIYHVDMMFKYRYLGSPG